jgi:hypothetical protein
MFLRVSLAERAAEVIIAILGFDDGEMAVALSTDSVSDSMALYKKMAFSAQYSLVFHITRMITFEKTHGVTLDLLNKMDDIDENHKARIVAVGLMETPDARFQAILSELIRDREGKIVGYEKRELINDPASFGGSLRVWPIAKEKMN